MNATSVDCCAFGVKVLGCSCICISIFNIMESMFIAYVVDKYIKNIIVEVQAKIKEQGFDRWTLKHYEGSYSAPNPNMFSIRMLIQDLLFGGADNFEAKNITYDSPTSSIRFEVHVPQLILKSGLSSVTVKLFDQDLNSKFQGWVGVKNLRVLCKAKMVMDESREFKFDNWDVALDVESITSIVKFTVLGMDLSEKVNTFLSVKLVELIKSHGNRAKEVLEGILMNLGGAQPDITNCLAHINMM